MDQVPIIDREIFFGNPEISSAQLSPNGGHISFVKPLNGVKNIWLKGKGDDFKDAIPITKDNRPITGYFWSRDGQYILYAQDKNGDENFCIYRVTVSEASHDVMPQSVNLTPYDDIRASIEKVSKLDFDKIFIGINDRDKAWHDLYELSISTGERSLIYENIDQISGFQFDLQDQLRMITRPNVQGGMDVLNFDMNPEKREILFSSDINDTLFPMRFLPNGEEVYIISNQGEDRNFTSLFKYRMDTKEMKLVHEDPEQQVDIDNISFSKVTDDMAVIWYNGAVPRMYFVDDGFEADFKEIMAQFDGSYINVTSSDDDEKEWLVGVFNDRDPGTIYHYDRETKSLSFLYHPRPEMPLEDLAEVQHITYESIDGLTIPAYLTTPRDTSAKAAVVLVHGGPWARDYYGYNSYAQFLANRGYYVLQPNFRSSTGFGKAFLNAGNHEWGRKMQDDITAGAGYLVRHHLAAVDKIAIMGGSYGGYATLAALAFTPDIFAAGIDIVGPSSLLTLLSSIPPYWEAGRRQLYMRVGDPETEEGAAMLRERSPLFSAEKMKAPLMVVQGANDPRVKQAESDQIVRELHSRDFPVQYLVAEDEGHGFRDPINNMAMLAAIEKFLSTYIGGRYQEEVPEHISNRLEELVQDVGSLNEKN